MLQSQPRLTFWQIWNMSFGFLGIQFGWGLQMANMSPIYKYLGAEEKNLPFLWLAGPITGLFIQPIVGALSDRTWTRFGRRRPYFLVGAIVASLCLIAMPFSSALWMAAGLLWIMDASINITMEPFRAFVADKLPPEQRTTGFVMQSFFIGIGQTLANVLPFILSSLGVAGVLASGIPHATLIAFIVGAIFFLFAVLWTVVSTEEYPPENLGEQKSAPKRGSIIATLFQDIWNALIDMPLAMKQLAVVQFFTWFGLFCLWQSYSLVVSEHVFHAANDKTPEFQRGVEWAGLCFAVYNVVCFAVAFALPIAARRTSRKWVHSICLLCGGLGMLSTSLAESPYFLWVGMAGLGIAWASILSMPYAMLANSVRPDRMGVYMGVFNLFIVLPQAFESLVVPWIYEPLLKSSQLNLLMLGGAMMIVASLLVFIVQDRETGSDLVSG